MKKYVLSILIAVCLVATVYALDYFKLINLQALKDGYSNSAVTGEENAKPNTKLADVSVEYYFQEPETGEYQLEKTLYYSVAFDKTFYVTYENYEYYLFNAELSNIIEKNPTDESVLTLYYDCELCTVTFIGGADATLTGGNSVQTLRKGQTPSAPEFFKLGYEVEHYDRPIEKVYEDTIFTAQWKEKEYTLTLVLVSGATILQDGYNTDGVNGYCYLKAFTYFTQTFELPTPIYDGYEFQGWYLNAEGRGERYYTVDLNTSSDLIFYSVFNVKTYAVNFESPVGYDFQPIVAPAGTKIYPPKVTPEKQIAGQGLNWYSDSNCANLYTFTVMPKQNITLYGKWEVDSGAGIFNFDISDLIIDSEEELVLLFDYVAFNYHTKESRIEVNVKYATEENYFTQEKIQEIMAKMQYPASTGLEFLIYKSTSSGTKFSVYLKKDCKNKEGLLVFDDNEVTPYKYLECNYINADTPHGLYVESLPISVEVETSNQLFYVVEHGYKPICKSGSPAETVYNKAKEVLNSIISAHFSDYDKALAIFDYLVLNVKYDLVAYETSPDNWGDYDAWFLEGVFNSKKAVCDGISKAYSLMCNMEGIPCVQVAGNEHAWCKVKINNRWSIVDPTYGNTIVENKGVISHEHFLMSESQKRKLGYFGMPYQNINANYSLNYFSEKTFTLNDNSYNFIAGSSIDIARIIEYYKTKGDLKGSVIDFIYTGKLFELELKTALKMQSYNGNPGWIPLHTYEHGAVAKVIFY